MVGRPQRAARGGPQSPDGGASPARGYSWATLTPGHTVTMRHGVHSERRVDPLASELVAGVLADRPDLERHPEAVMAWARAEARCILVDEYLAANPPWSDDGQRLLSWATRVESLAQKMRERLGLDPQSEAALARERAVAAHESFDLEAVIEAGRKVIAARAIGGDDDGDDDERGV